LNHFRSPSFRKDYADLPRDVQRLADRAFHLLKSNPRHPSLHFKKAGRYHSVRIGRHYRALAVEGPDGLVWFWIGSHAEYDNILQ
jgi:hypothetical protein